MDYIKYTEFNDWEGETWHFYIPIKGNEEAVTDLRGICDGECYCVADELIPEEEVDVLVKHSAVGYMRKHNKLSGKLTPTEDLYKGGIVKMMEENDGGK